MPNLRKALIGGASSALASAPSANPFLIGGSALVGTLPGLFEEERTFDPNPFRQGFKRTSRVARRRARRSGQEVRNRTRASAAAQGLSGSELSQGISDAAERATRQRTDDALALQEAELEDNIAHAEAYIDQANQADRRADLRGLTNAVISTGHHIATKNSPLRKALGIADVTDADLNIAIDSNPFRTTPESPAKKPTPRQDRRYEKPGARPIVPEDGREPGWDVRPPPDRQPVETPDGPGGAAPPQDRTTPTPDAPRKPFDPTERGQVPRPDTGPDTDKIQPPGAGDLPNLGDQLNSASTTEEIQAHLSQSGIDFNSPLGQLFSTNPEQLGLLETLFGADWLMEAFTLV